MKRKPLVLFVDDENSLLASMRRTLRNEPYEVLTALSGQIGLSILKQREVDVVISDESMPGMDGVEFLSTVAKEYPSTVRMMLTGKAQLDTVIKAINEGQIFRFISKPCSEVELGMHIRQCLQHRELLVQARRMLGTLKMQAAYIKSMEQEIPGISKVERDESGTIILELEDCDTEKLLREIEEELDK